MKTDMTVGSPGRHIIMFTIPLLIGNIFQQFYNMADTIIVGRFVGENALAAVGASYSYTNVFIMIAIGGGMGASVLTSQYLGAGAYGNMRTSIYTALFAFLGLSLALTLFGFAMNPAIMQALNTPENIYDDAMLYLQIYFAGLPFLFMYNILSSVFNALGKSRIPLGLLIFSSLLNVFLDLWMVIQWKLGVAGVAIATVIAQGLSAVISFLILMKVLRSYPKGGEGSGLFNCSMLVRGTKIAVPSIVQQSIVSIGMLLVQSVVNSFGSSVLAGYSAGTRVESVCIVPMIATGNAVSTFTAQNLGAGQRERVKKGLYSGYLMVGAFAVIIALLIFFFHDGIVGAFMDSQSGLEAFRTGNAYVTFIGWFFVLIGLKASTDGVLRGAGDVGVYMAANLANLAIRVIVANLCAPIWGIEAVWYAVPMGWAVNFLISFSWYLTGRWKRKKLIA